MNNLIFVDCETTGLKESTDHIVELALVAVELPTFKEVAHFSAVVAPPLWPTVERNLHERVRSMHDGSGLLKEIRDAYDAEANAYPTIETQALAFVRQWAPQTMNWHTPMAGANPDFDRRFLRARMPKLHQAFHYRNFDVRSITLLSDWVFGTLRSEGAPHRALADCRKAISDVRKFIGIEKG